MRELAPKGERLLAVTRLWIVTLALAVLAGCASSPSAVPFGSCAGATAEASGACSTPLPTTPPGGLSREAAVAAAQRHAPASAAQPIVVWARVGPDPFTLPATSRTRLVWMVRLQGSFDASPCPSGYLDKLPSASDPACLDNEGGLVVVLDVFTGALIGWTH